MAQLPVHVPGLVILLAGVLAWRREDARVWARILLGSGTALLLGALRYPGLGADEIVAQTGDGLAYLVAVARVTGVAALLFCGATALRERLAP
jgi:hypothetical protein